MTVLDPAARAELRTTTSTVHPYPVFTGRSGGDRAGLPSWWGRATFPMGMWVVGHNGGPHAPIAVGEDSSVWTPCEFPAFSAEAAAAIVDGYVAQSDLS